MKSIIRFVCIAAFAAMSFVSSLRADSFPVFTGIYAGYPYGYSSFYYGVWPMNYWLAPYSLGFGYGNIFYPYIPTYGVIAYSPTKDVGGYAWGQPSIDDAASTALSFCGAEDCQPVVWVQGGCAALATSRTTKSLGWAYAVNKTGAIYHALRACRASGNAVCQRRGWVCSF